jgi:hypothetical protein
VGLWADFLTNDQRVIVKWKHYFPVYERHLTKFVNTDVVFIEIGVGEGGSLQMWKRYLGPFARIVGIDIKLDEFNALWAGPRSRFPAGAEGAIAACRKQRSDLKTDSR